MMANETHVAALQNAIAAGRSLVVLGAGATASTSNLSSASSWMELLESGLDYALTHRHNLPPGFESSVRAQLSFPDYVPGLTAAADLITRELGGAQGSDFRDWLRQAVGEAQPDRPNLLNAVLRLGVPVATVNYDTLIERVSGRTSRTWQSPVDVQAALSGITNDVVHLHGLWHEPDSVVFGSLSYGRMMGNDASQALEKAVGALRSMIFVGCGDGLVDPNFAGLVEWLNHSFPNSSLKHYRLCRVTELLALGDDPSGIIPVSYGENYGDLPSFVESLAPQTAIEVRVEAGDKTRAEILDRLRNESVFAEHLPDIDVRTIEQLVVPPVLLPVTYEQFAAAQRDEDGPKIDRIDIRKDLQEHRHLIVVGEESSGLTTALQWLVAHAQTLEAGCAPLLIDSRGLAGARPLDRAARIALRQSGASIDNRMDLPQLALALDNLAPSGRGAFPKVMNELPFKAASWLIVGCRPGAEAQIDSALRAAGLKPVTRYLGRMNTGDIRSLAALVAPAQAQRLADKAVTIIQREHLARTPLTVCLLVSVLMAGEALLSTASETALLDAYVNLLLGRGSAYDDARFVLDSHENQSLLAELAHEFVKLNAGAVDESVAIATFERYFERVGWTESATEALGTLVRRHVLVRRAGKVAFSQASLLHLFAAKRAVNEPSLKATLLGQPLYYADIIKHYAALTRNDEGLVAASSDMIEQLNDVAVDQVKRGSQLSLESHEDVANDGNLENVLKALDRPLQYRSDPDGEPQSAPGAQLDPLDEVADEDWVPFPLTPVQDMPFLSKLIRTLGLASNILRDSEEVQNLELKRQVLAKLLRSWGVLVDALEADAEFVAFLDGVTRRVAKNAGLPADKVDKFVETFSELGPLLVALTGLTSTLSSRKLALTLMRVLDDEDFAKDSGVAIMGAMLASDIRHRGWAAAFTTVNKHHSGVKATGSVLRPAAQSAYYYADLDDLDLKELESFLGDYLSLRAGRDGTQGQKRGRAQIVQKLKRNRLQLSLKRAKVDEPRQITGTRPATQ